MRSLGLLVVAVCALVRLAGADVKAEIQLELDIEAKVGELPQHSSSDKDQPRFAFSNDDAYPVGADPFGNQPSFGGSVVELDKSVVAVSADGKTAWIAANAKGVLQSYDCAPGPCGKNTDPPLHLTAVVEKTGTQWSWVAWHVANPTTAKEQAYLIKQGTLPDVLPKAIAGAEDVVKVFEASLGDPKAFAATVSDRADVVLYGSELAERTVGGAKVKSKLAAWKLAFKVRDGLQAGLSTSKTVAWVAANVDATSIKKPTNPAEPYRVLAVYEKAGSVWKLVQAHFSFDKRTYKK